MNELQIQPGFGTGKQQNFLEGDVMDDVMNGDWWTEREAAKYLGCVPGTLNKDRCQRVLKIPYFRIGRKVRYRKRELDLWVESTRVN